MSNPLHAGHYADSALSRTVEVVENIQIATDTCRLRFRCPEIANRVRPGQFLMVRLAACDDPLIGRPFALYDTAMSQAADQSDSGPDLIDVVYLVKGKLTSRLRHIRPGEWLDVWGPLGNGFRRRSCRHLLMVAGGIGQTPFLTLGQWYLGTRAFGWSAGNGLSVPPADRVTLCYGARSADRLAGIPDFQDAGIEVRVATDDGSEGHQGLVTDLLDAALTESNVADVHVVCCGPEPMMAAVCGVAARHGASCEVSLETPMACGIGICFSCVAPIIDEAGVADFKRTCVEGPVFDGQKVAWS